MTRNSVDSNEVPQIALKKESRFHLVNLPKEGRSNDSCNMSSCCESNGSTFGKSRVWHEVITFTPETRSPLIYAQSTKVRLLPRSVQ